MEHAMSKLVHVLINFRTLVFPLIVGCFCSAAIAQPDPRSVLKGVIDQVQTGKPNQSWYSPALWQTIAMQTGSTGIYPQLAHLGPVSNVAVLQQAQLPGGTLYALRANHTNGVSNWLLGFGNYSNRIEYANFEIGTPMPMPNPTVPAPTPTKPSPTPSDSEACKQFPNLC